MYSDGAHGKEEMRPTLRRMQKPGYTHKRKDRNREIRLCRPYAGQMLSDAGRYAGEFRMGGSMDPAERFVLSAQRRRINALARQLRQQRA